MRKVILMVCGVLMAAGTIMGCAMPPNDDGMTTPMTQTE